MPNENIDLTVRLRDARKFVGDTKAAAGGVKQIGGAVDDVDKKARRAEKSTHRLRGSFNLLSGGARLAIGGVGTAAGIYGVAGAMKLMYDEATEARKATAQTNAVLKSTGGAANVTAKHVNDLSTAISNKVGIDDEAIQSTENLLLTFTKIRNETGKGNDVFDQATRAVTDMSVALKQDGKSSAIQLGKALKDPIAGATALRRAGVSLSKQQQDRIKALVGENKLRDAQKIILREVNKEFGGSAEAAATPVDKLNTSFHNLAETAGTYLLPYIDKGANSLAKFINEMQTGKGDGGKFVDTLKDIGHAVGPPLMDLVHIGEATAKFVGKHPELAKIGGDLIAVGLAVKAIRFGGAITGVDSLLRLLGRIPGRAGKATVAMEELDAASMGGPGVGGRRGARGGLPLAGGILGGAALDYAMFMLFPDETSATDTVTGRTPQQQANRMRDPNYRAYLERQAHRRARRRRRPRAAMPRVAPRVAQAGIPTVDSAGAIVDSVAQPIQLFIDGKLVTEIVGGHSRDAKNHR